MSKVIVTSKPSQRTKRLCWLCGIGVAFLLVIGLLFQRPLRRWYVLRTGLPSKAVAPIERALSDIEHPGGSGILLLTTELTSGTSITVRGRDAVIKVEQPCYLLFIDERPDYDWGHRAKVVLVPLAKGESPLVYNVNWAIEAKRIKDGRGRPVGGKWVRL